jgi:hypothetical protein
MPTITTMYGHDALSTFPGTLPGTSSQSLSFPDGSAGASAYGVRILDGNHGLATATASAALPLSIASTQHLWLRRFVLNSYLAGQTIGAGNWTVRGSFSCDVSTGITNKALGAVLCVWRPEPGVLVGRVFDSPTTSGTTLTASSWSDVSATITGGAVTCQDGDVLVLEVWMEGLRDGSHLSTNDNLYFRYDGGTVGTNELVLTAPAALTIMTAGTLDLGSMSVTCAALVGAGPEPETSTAPLTMTIEADWTQSGVWVDESHYCRGVSIQRGRQRVNDGMAAGTCTLRLRNIDGRFSPFNSSSAIYGQIKPNVPIRVTAAYHGVSIRQFVGQLTEAGQQTLASQAETTILCLDAFDRFRQAADPGSLGLGQQNQTSDRCANAMLDAYGWSGTSRSLDTGKVLAVFAPAGNLLQALQLAQSQELGGTVFIDKSGNVRFEAQTSRPNAVLTGSLDSSTFATAPGGNQLSIRLSDLIDRAEVSYGAYSTVGAPNTAIYTMSGSVNLPVGSTYVTGTFTSPGAVSVTPPVYSTDWTFSGAGPVSMRRFDYDAAGFSALFVNSGYTGAALTSLVVRGVAVQTNTSPPLAILYSAAPQVTDQPQSRTAAYVTDGGVAQTWAREALLALQAVRPRPVLTINGTSPGLIHLILTAELGSRILLLDTSAPWLSGFAGDFYIEAISLNWVPGGLLSAQWTLFDHAQAIV